jgi:hypothetical protein
MTDRLGYKHERVHKAKHGDCKHAGKDDADNNNQSSVKLLGFKAWSHKLNPVCTFQMDCRSVVRIQVFASLLGLGMGSDMTRHNHIPRNPTIRPQLVRRSR